MKKSSKAVTEKFIDIPLFPITWIWREIGFHEPISPAEWVPEENYPSLKKAEPILKRLSAQGADPNYIVSVLYYHSDPNKNYEFWRVDKEEDLSSLYFRKGYSRFVTAKEYQLGKKALKTIERHIPDLEKIVGTDKVLSLKESISGIKEEIQHFDKPEIISYELIIPIRLEKPKKGRPAQENFNKMVHLLYRHFKKQIKFLPGHKGIYSVIAELVNACFNKALGRKHILNVIKNYSRDREIRRHCKTFEGYFLGMGERFLDRVKGVELPLKWGGFEMGGTKIR